MSKHFPGAIKSLKCVQSFVQMLRKRSVTDFVWQFQVSESRSDVFTTLLIGIFLSVTSILFFGSGDNSTVFAADLRNAIKSEASRGIVSVDPTFNPSGETSPGNARAVLLQPNGKVQKQHLNR